MNNTVVYAILPSAMNIGGKNHPEKIQNGGATKIEYDEEKDHLLITHNNQMARIKHYTAIVYGVQQPAKVAHAVHGKIKAQVSTPQDHVFATAPGKTHS